MEITTIAVSPENADGLRAVRDERNLRSMDAALEQLLEKAYGETPTAESTN
ncbi:hypothetical protein [Halalkalicoccus jeotgali]|uniref:Uncharacterized protein n=1 Tax=Halalkalicoccus jeotgali (strain DSM 18796 / CECT 7217 / JCM 14584 / KCTC 4019 / B3) TaxID=795797 RepID=D8JCR1_HALJB|nr:hypothetical protein [Halalkalicoccus jeotgali]ADJ16806.1 hypothetical protein HacjB3_17318 [Halalkalicoccus jeotgali B3]ADJ17200.1 hypothetical protein HacjB3_19318 [Halalkalicoccus jeotgali B3]ELY41666.1 hypothetical protein C497_00215 [Halalkalicoccus jeotgali B3]